MALRLGAFAWIYLLGEAWAIHALAMVELLPRDTAINWFYRAATVWLDWNFDALRMTFGLTLVNEDTSAIPPGPILLLSRHASMIDTMLPARYVVKPHGIKLRYVLKKELLIDPTLDIGGNRLPNYFIDRRGSARAEVAALGASSPPVSQRMRLSSSTRKAPATARRSGSGSAAAGSTRAGPSGRSWPAPAGASPQAGGHAGPSRCKHGRRGRPRRSRFGGLCPSQGHVVGRSWSAPRSS